MRIKLNSRWQHTELTRAVARLVPATVERITIRATYAEWPADLTPSIVSSLAYMQAEARDGGTRGRLNALGSLRRAIAKAGES